MIHNIMFLQNTGWSIKYVTLYFRTSNNILQPAVYLGINIEITLWEFVRNITVGNANFLKIYGWFYFARWVADKWITDDAQVKKKLLSFRGLRRIVFKNGFCGRVRYKVYIYFFSSLSVIRTRNTDSGKQQRE